MKYKIEYLADKQETIPTIAKWYFNQWGYLKDDATLASTEKQLLEYINKEKIPLILLAYSEDELAGVAQLKYFEMEYAFPDKESWLGGVYVNETYRGNGIATMLAENISSIARTFKIKTLYLQTEDLTGGLYAKLGWKPIQEYQREKVLVLVMEKDLRT